MARRMIESVYIPDWHRTFPNSARMTDNITRLYLKFRQIDRDTKYEVFLRFKGLSDDERNEFLDSKTAEMESLSFKLISLPQDEWVHYISWLRRKSEDEVVDCVLKITQIFEVNPPVEMKVDRSYWIRVKDRNGKLEWRDEGCWLMEQARDRAEGRAKRK